MDIIIIRDAVTRRKLNDIAKQQFCDMWGSAYNSDLASPGHYFLHFAIAARTDR